MQSVNGGKQRDNESGSYCCEPIRFFLNAKGE
jgi:hypothetical protein